MNRILAALCLVLISFFVQAQISDTTFAARWQRADSLYFEKNRTRDALMEVKAIYNDAKKARMQLQVIKSLIYRLHLEDIIEDKQPAADIQTLINESLQTSDPVAKAIFYSMIAEEYHTYFKANRYKIYNRSQTATTTENDIATWGPGHFHRAITYWHLRSIENEQPLQMAPIQMIAPVLTQNNSQQLRPTVYDLLAHRALDYFQTDETYIHQPEYAFTISDAAALGTIEAFLQHRFETRDTASNKWKALLLFQKLTGLHYAKQDTAALVDINLHRLQYVNNHATIENKDSLYYQSVLATASRFATSRYAAQAWYLLAVWHLEKGNVYRYNSDTTYSNDITTALDIAKRFVPLSDSTEAHYKLLNLYNDILKPELNLQTEQVYVPGANIRALVHFNNVDTLFYRIIPVNRLVEDSLEQGYYQRNNVFSYLKQAEYISQHQQQLPTTSDYRLHNAEFKIDPLPVGEYMLLAAATSNFADTAPLVMVRFHVSDIAYINNGQHYFVLNRTTGQPLADARVQLWEYEYKGGKGRMLDKKERYTTNNNGYFLAETKKNESRNIQLEITTGNDYLFLKRGENIYTSVSYSTENTSSSREDWEENHSVAYFFTDRSIYRPGQKMHFKMLALTKDFDTRKPKLITGNMYADSVYVYLEDPNGKTVDSIHLLLNEWGSLSGTFTIPAHTVTGEFSLSTTDFNDEKGGTISVEEYKRPTFYVTLHQPTGAYRLNDSLTIKGKAVAYSGATLNGATVKYNVTRSTRFLYPWLWRRWSVPVSPQTTITFGEALTDAEGNFAITFKAAPDQQINRSTLPIFDFEITADVTDPAGETRSQTDQVGVGYHSLNLKLNLPATANADSLRSFFVSATNLAGDKVNTPVEVTIYQLNSPKQPIKKRYWQQPDTYIYTKQEFSTYFPNDEYSNEADPETWSTGSQVYTTKVQTGSSERVEIPKNILGTGWYLVEAVSTDKDGNQIKDIKRIQLYTLESGSFNGNQYLFTSTILNVVAPGEAAAFLVGSAAPHVYLIQEVQRPQSATNGTIQSNFFYHQLDSSIQTIKVVPSMQDRQGLSAHFVFVKDNRMFFWSQEVLVSQPDDHLKIDVLSYRNKMEPGSKEQWTISVSGTNNEAVAAEVLTSMYDASLDQFKPHNWQQPSFYQQQFWGDTWSQNASFSSNTGTINHLEHPIFDQRVVYANLLTTSIGQEALRRFAARSGRNMDRALAGAVPGIKIEDVQLNEAVVVGYGAKKSKSVAAAAIQIRGTSTVAKANQLFIVDGQVVENIASLNPDDIASTSVLSGAEATALYGQRAAQGAIVITTKTGNSNNQVPAVQVRTNFAETAFFFPRLHTNAEGKLSFTFTMPEALTEWKWQMLAHSTNGLFAMEQRTVVTQKTLMVQTNSPRFLRQGDRLELSARINNLDSGEVTGSAVLQLIDATNGQLVDGLFFNHTPRQFFTAAPRQSTLVRFSIEVPFKYTHPLTWRVVATAGTFADGEENTIAVLSNRILVTESQPLYVRTDSVQRFEFKKLKEQQSETLQHQSLTVEATAHPIWYVVQSLPYLMEYPYECAEQTFNRFFANALASSIVQHSPRIEKVFEQWAQHSRDSAGRVETFWSNLQKNAALKNILLEETPWVMQAQTEAQQKQHIALLFDVVKTYQSINSAVEKLQALQLSNGGFPWFKGGSADRYITQYIVTAIGRLQAMDAVPPSSQKNLDAIVRKALPYLDDQLNLDYNNLFKYKVSLKDQKPSPIQLQYLYMRSYFLHRKMSDKQKMVQQYFLNQAKKYWIEENTFFKTMLAATLLQHQQTEYVKLNLVPALLQNAVVDKDAGMYWKDMQAGYYWYQSPIEQQALTIELLERLTEKDAGKYLQDALAATKTWLLRQKQTTHWRTTKATADACYALLLNNNWLNSNKEVTVQLGAVSVSTRQPQAEAGTGYVKKVIEGENVVPEMGNITVAVSGNNNAAPVWGAVHWQYFEDLQNITPAATPLSITKQIFTQKNTEIGPTLVPVEGTVKVGDKLMVRVILRSDRDMEYIHLKDMRPAASEPVNVLSSYKWQDGLGYYESTRDASTNFFISYLPKGTYVFEYPLFVTHNGTFTVGIATAQCMYAPEFNSQTGGLTLKVREE